MYEKHVLDHYRNPRRKGEMPPDLLPILEGASVSEVCGDKINIHACIGDGIIADIWWQGEGCCFSQAAASMLVKYAYRKTVAEMKEFTGDNMFSLFRAECPKIRRGCVLVAWNALQEILEQI